MWFLFSILALLFWAGSDLFSKLGTDPKDRYSHLRLVITVGAVMGVHAVAYMLIEGIRYDPVNLLRYLPVSALYILSMALGYAGLRYIELSLSSPVCNSSGAVVCLLCFLFLGDRLTVPQIAAVVCICAGVVLLSVLERRRAPIAAADAKYARGALALLFPIAYCVIDALGTFADALVLDGDDPLFTEAEAELSYEFTFLIVAVCAYVFLVAVKKQRFSFIREKSFSAAAVCETAGQFFYVFAMAARPMTAAPVIGSYCVLSVLLSRIFLREKLSGAQYAAIFLVFAGIILLGILEGLAEAA